MSFSPEFPAELQSQIVAAIVAFSESDPETFEAAFDAYSWTGVAPTNDAEFDSIRAVIQAQGFDLGDL